MTTGTVTVVIPTRDRDHLLGRAIASVAAQTVLPLEVVVVGDGAVPRIESASDLVVRVVMAPPGTGAGECRNIGAREARGDWVALLDDDDEWLPTKLERQLALAAAGCHTVVACRVQVEGVSTSGRVWPRRLPAAHERISDYLLRRESLTVGETLVQTSMLLVRRDVLLRVPFTTGLTRHQEWDWLIRVEADQLLRLGFVETAESVWHSDDRQRITGGGDWRSSLAWVTSLAGLASDDTVRSFVLTFLPRIARQGGDGWAAALAILAAARPFGRPRARELVLFAACWLLPSPRSRVGRALRSGAQRRGRRGPDVSSTSPRRRSVLIVQPYVANYRREFYEELRSQLAAKDIALQLLIGRAQGQNALRKDAASLPWATEVPAHLIDVGGRLLRFKGRWRGPAQDLVVLPHGSGWMDNYPVLARRRQPIGLWGQGRPYTSEGHVVDRALERWQLSRADHYFSYTEAGGRSLTAAGWPQERITVLNNTFDTSELSSLVASVDPRDTHELRKVLTRGRTGLFVGGLDEAKRIEFLIRAGDRISQRLDGFTLLVAGAGHDEPLVRGAAESRPWLRFVGQVEAAEKARLASVSDVLMMPGRVGLVAVDSFALGIPIVTTSWPWHAPEFDYLDDGNSVVSRNDLDDYVEAVCALLSDGARRAGLAARCRADAAEYTVQEMARRFVEGVERALALRADGPAATRSHPERYREPVKLVGRVGQLARIIGTVARDPTQVRHLSRYAGSMGRSPLVARQPWLPFDVIDWLDAQVGPSTSVFEYGGGGSSAWFADRVGRLVTVESDADWARALRDALASEGSVEIRHAGAEDGYQAYVSSIDDCLDGDLDLVVVDGRERVRCVERAREKVRPGGYLLLDDAERPQYAAVPGLLSTWARKDFHGITPWKSKAGHTSVWRRPGL